MNYNSILAEVRMVHIFCPKITRYLGQIRKKLSEDEHINFHWWTGNRFYIEVEDTQKGWKHPENIRLFLTVDVKKDKVIFNNSKDDGFGGNCGARTIKWKRALSKMFMEEYWSGDKEKFFHFYKSRYLKGVSK